MPSSPPDTAMPHEWIEHGLVVLAGAGVSMGAPANVPSWWGFNQAVLAGLRREYVSSFAVPVRSRKALDGLSLNELDLAEFSQVVHNAFAGATWFRLLRVLDGAAPNTTHRTIASLAHAGVLRGVVTTNFDTLLERTMSGRAVAFNALLDEPPERPGVAVVKLHGSANLPASLVDLAAQKRTGIRPAWRSWLGRAFARHCVVVLGFSGADLELGADYLGLQTAAASTPWLGWNVRAARAPHPKAVEVLTAAGERSRLVEGDLPGVMEALGVSLVTVPGSGSRADERVRVAIDEWLDEPQVDADVCGVALSRLLVSAGARSAAEALRSAIRTRTRRALRQGVDLERAARASLILGQVATDDDNAARSMQDIDLAERALDRVVDHLRRSEVGLSERGEIEYARNKAKLAHDRAVHYLRKADAINAQLQIDRAWAHIEALPEWERADRLSAHWQNAGGVAWLKGDRASARDLFEKAHAAAVQVGDLEFITRTEETLRRIAVADKHVGDRRAP